MPKRLLWRETYHLRPFKRHSLVLLVLGLVYICIGGSMELFDQKVAGRSASLHLALAIMPLGGWGIVWIVVGLLGVLSSRWPPSGPFQPHAAETWGYTLLSALSAWWACVYVWGVLVYGAPPATISGALVWGGVAFLWWAISGLQNPVTDHKGNR